MRGKGRRRESTRTSEFGVSSRENHDSSKFYSRRLYDSSYGEYRQANVNNIETAIPVESLDKIFCKSSERMDELPDNSIHLAVTSPPYNVGKEYDGDLTIDQYRELLRKVFLEIYRVIADGGRVCINVANLGRKPYIPLHSHVIQDMLACGFLMRGEIIWNKGPSAGASTAWGSWQSASNPTLRDVHEYVLVFSKGSFSRRSLNNKSTISKEEFLQYTKSIWEFHAESAKKVGHPAPFPVELPYRCIQLYTFSNDIILDPFCGVGSSCVAALKAGRHFIGYETNINYVHSARARVHAFLQRREI
jgi:modification methylase